MEAKDEKSVGVNVVVTITPEELKVFKDLSSESNAIKATAKSALRALFELEKERSIENDVAWANIVEKYGLVTRSGYSLRINMVSGDVLEIKDDSK